MTLHRLNPHTHTLWERSQLPLLPAVVTHTGSLKPLRRALPHQIRVSHRLHLSSDRFSVTKCVIRRFALPRRGIT